jgi:hypothetical protein
MGVELPSCSRCYPIYGTPLAATVLNSYVWDIARTLRHGDPIIQARERDRAA